MMVSPFTPLFFIDRKTDGVACEYVQTFATTDQILIELIGENDWGGGARVIDGFTKEPLFEITLNIRVINEETTLRFATLSLSPGVYSVEIDGIGKSQSVKITDNVKELLCNWRVSTVLSLPKTCNGSLILILSSKRKTTLSCGVSIRPNIVL